MENGSIEGCVVGGEKIDALQDILEVFPDLAEGRGVGHVLPRDPVDVRKHEFSPGRTDEARLAPNNAGLLDPDDSDGAGAVPPEVRRLKVDRDERSALSHRPYPTRVSASRLR